MAGVARRSRSGPRPHGRHFLRSRALAAAIVADAGIGAGDLVLDLGAGAGALTRELSRRAGRVWAVELDASLARELERRFAGTNVRVLHADATRLRWPCEPFKVVANVPFHRTTAILRGLLDDPSVPLVAAELVVQWELAAKRAAVWPSTLTGVYWGAWHRFALVRRLPPCAFAPEPAVAAGVLRIERRADPLVAARDRAAWRAFVKRGFAAGRPEAPPHPSSASDGSSASRRRRGHATSTRPSGRRSFAPSARRCRLPRDPNPFNPVQRGRKGVE